MRQTRFHVLALVLALLAHVLVGSGAFHDHLEGERPGACVSCGAASQSVLLPVVVPPVLAARAHARPSLAPPRAPARALVLALDARGPPRAGCS